MQGLSKAGALLLLAVVAAFAAGQADLTAGTDAVTIPQLINYQGKLTDGAGNPLNTTVDMTFNIYDGATLTWTETQTGVVVADGIFNVLLGSVSAISGLPDAGNCSLEVVVGTEPIAPKIPLVAVPYAYHADNAGKLQGTPVSGTAPTADQVLVYTGGSWTPTTVAAVTGSGTAGRVARWTAATTLGDGSIQDDGAGYIGVGAGPLTNYAVYGYTTGYGAGVYGVSSVDVGVYGVSNGWNGVLGQTYYAGRAGVWGYNGAASGYGVYGYGPTYGVYGNCGSGTYGVVGYAASASYARGVYGYTGGSYSYGVYGYTGGGSYSYAVHGYNAYNGTRGALGHQYYGVYGYNGSTSYYAGVYGYSYPNYSYGVYGFAYGNYAYGVYGVCDWNYGAATVGYTYYSTSYGVYGYNSSGPGVGGYGSSSYGAFYGYNTAGYYARVAYSSYKIYGTGSVATFIIDENDRERTLVCPEAPEVVFEDYGSSQLVNGRARVEIDPLLLRGITINEQHPLRVYVTPTTGEAIPLGVSKNATSFEVRGPSGSNATFDWRIVATRKGYEDQRFVAHARPADRRGKPEPTPMSPWPEETVDRPTKQVVNPEQPQAPTQDAGEQLPPTGTRQ